MKQKDHRALAHYLMNHLGDPSFFRKSWNRRFFILGSISPDYIPFTYLRGFRKSHGMLGHNADYSGRAIQKKMRRLEEKGLARWRDCLRMGSLMHYLADSFTHPHTSRFSGDMREHRRYERELHEHFLAFLEQWKRISEQNLTNEHPIDLLRRLRREYQTGDASPESDCIGILNACSAIFDRLHQAKAAVE